MWLRILSKSETGTALIINILVFALESWITIRANPVPLNHRSGPLADFLYHIALDLQTPARNSGVQSSDLYTACLHSCSSAMINGHAWWSNAPPEMLISLQSWPWLASWVAPGSHTLQAQLSKASQWTVQGSFDGQCLRVSRCTVGWGIAPQVTDSWSCNNIERRRLFTVERKCRCI